MVETTRIETAKGANPLSGSGSHGLGISSSNANLKEATQSGSSGQLNTGASLKPLVDTTACTNRMPNFPVALMALQADGQSVCVNPGAQELSSKGIHPANPYLFWSQLGQNNLQSLGAAAIAAQNSPALKPYGFPYWPNQNLFATANFAGIPNGFPQMEKTAINPAPQAPCPTQAQQLLHYAAVGEAASRMMVYPSNYMWSVLGSGRTSVHQQETCKPERSPVDWPAPDASDTVGSEKVSVQKSTNKRRRSEEGSEAQATEAKPTQLLPQKAAYESIEEQLQALPSRRPKRVRRNSGSVGTRQSTRDAKKDSKKTRSGQTRGVKVKKKSKYRGVFWQTRESTWVASIMVRGVKSHLGYFSDEKTAAIEYDKAAMRLKGPSSYFNFPENISSYGIEKDKDGGKSGRAQTRKAVRSSKYRGVCWNKCNHSWKACIKLDGRNLHIGYYDDEVDAAKAYDMKAMQMKQSKAILNFPQEFRKLNRTSI